MVNARVALMSIRPEYAGRIFAGEKRVELRRQRPRLEPGDLVLVYVTSPVKEVQGAFRVKRIVSLDLRAMWRAFGESLGVARATFDRYFSGCTEAHGIVIAETWTTNPLSLDALQARFEGFRPPQSYMYWPDRWDMPRAWANAPLQRREFVA